MDGNSFLIACLAKFINSHLDIILNKFQSANENTIKILACSDHTLGAAQKSRVGDHKEKLQVEREVELPCIRDCHMIHSGLTTVVRKIVFKSHSIAPEYGFNHLLGYKETCFKACSEVSPWTNLVSGLKPVIESFPLSALLFEDLLNQIERLLERKSLGSSYKRSFYKSDDQGTLKYFYNSLLNSKVSGQYITGSLPNLVDILVYFVIALYMEKEEEFQIKIERYKQISQWLKLMEMIPQLKSVITSTTSSYAELENFSEGSSTGINGCVVLVNKSPKNDNLSLVDSLTSLSLHNDKSALLKPLITDAGIVDRLKVCYPVEVTESAVKPLDWENLPSELDPARGGKLPAKRSSKKRQQLESMYFFILQVLSKSPESKVLVDFCAGCGHLGLLVAWFHPELQVKLVENKEESLLNAAEKIESLGLRNVQMYQCNLTAFHGTFDIGVTLHACGLATDLIINKCLQVGASMVICPCCYGTVHSTSIELPRSRQFQEIISCQEAITIRHSADKTEFGSELEIVGKESMALVDLDRAFFIDNHHGYTTTLNLMSPPTCSPKNHVVCSLFYSEDSNMVA